MFERCYYSHLYDIFSGENSPADSGFNSDDAAKKPKVDQNSGFEDILDDIPISFSAEDFTSDENWDLENIFENIPTSDLIANDGLISDLGSRFEPDSKLDSKLDSKTDSNSNFN